MSFLASLIDSLFPEAYRKGHFECPCGAVRGDLEVPASSHLLIEQTNAICHCKDCTNFVRACANGDYVMENNGTHAVNFYKSDINIVKGRDKIRAVKVYEASVLIRTYCSDCGTPLGMDVAPAPFSLIYQKLIKSGPIYLPSLVLGLKYALPGTREYSRQTPAHQGVIGPWFLIKTIARALIGLLFEKNHGGLLELSYEKVPIGLEKIEASSAGSSSGIDKEQ